MSLEEPMIKVNIPIEPTKPKELLINLKESLKTEPNGDGNKVEQVNNESLEVKNKRKNISRLWSKDEISKETRIKIGRKENHVFDQYQNSTNIDNMEEMNEGNQQIQVEINDHKEPNPNRRPIIKDYLKDWE
ncbi:21625_t:CDS:2 [Gigaspora rosea]|nr:21625_t:CDS:2 [Gigaspora rosea]